MLTLPIPPSFTHAFTHASCLFPSPWGCACCSSARQHVCSHNAARYITHFPPPAAPTPAPLAWPSPQSLGWRLTCQPVATKYAHITLFNYYSYHYLSLPSSRLSQSLGWRLTYQPDPREVASAMYPDKVRHARHGRTTGSVRAAAAAPINYLRTACV